MKIVITSILFGFSLCASAEKLRINTEEYAPLSFTENGIIKGIATEQVELILKRAGMEYELKVYPWARAYKNAELNKSTCVFSVSNTPERANLFKWVEPLSLNKSVLVKIKDYKINVSSLEDAKKYKIGIQNQDVGGAYLKKNGFPYLSTANTSEQTLLKLKLDRVNMAAMAESRFIAMREEGAPLEKVIDIFAIKMGLACNISIQDETIAKLQAELDKIINNGTQKEITDRYNN